MDEVSEAMAVTIGKMIKDPIITGLAGDIDEDKKTLSLVRAGYETLEGVRMQAADGKVGFMVIPKNGSAIAVGKIDDSQEYVLLQTTEIEKIQAMVGGLELEITAGKCSLKSGGISLIDELLKLIDVVRKIIVVQGTGPDLVKLTQIENNFKNLLY